MKTTISHGIPAGTACIRAVFGLVSAFLLLAPPAVHANGLTLEAALDSSLTFTTSGDAPWFPQMMVTSDGVDAVQSGMIGANQSTSLETQVTGPVSLVFQCRASCEGYGADFLSYGVDGNLTNQVAGEFPWFEAGPLLIPAGTHTVTWKYQKNGTVDAGSDCIYLDAVTTTPGTPPANDNYASRTNLGNPASTTAAGDNRFATLESGEDTFLYQGGGSGASVWWSWTAPATGLAKFEIEQLPGSMVSSIVALYTGTDLASLTRIGWTDSSRTLTVPVTSGQTYQIAVQGRSFVAGQIPQMGQFNLKITGAQPTPAYRLTALTITPGSVDVSLADASVTIDVTVSSDSAFTSGSLQLVRSNLTNVAFLAFGEGQRISGDNLNGTYRVTATIARYSVAGTYTVESILLGTCTYGANRAAPVTHTATGAGINYLLEVADSQPDTSPPLLNFAAVSPDPVDVRGGAQTVTIDAAIMDPLAGLRRWTVAIYRPDGSQADSKTYFPPTPLFGTIYDGIFRHTYDVPADAPGGTWTVGLTLVDTLHNSVIYGSGGLPFPNGPPEGTFEVVARSGNNDMFADRIDLGSVASANATASNVGATMEVGESYTGEWGGCSLWWSWTAPASGWAQVDTFGSEIDTVLGVFTGTDVAALTPVGWNVYAAGGVMGSKLVFPAVGGTTYQISVLGRWMHGGGFQEGNVALNILGAAPPPIEMTAMAPLPGSVDITGAPAVVDLTFTLALPEGFQEGSCWVYTPGSAVLSTVPFGPAQRISGDAFLGTYEVPVTIPRYVAPGEFTVEVDVIGASGNCANYANGAIAWADHVFPGGDFTISVQNTGGVDATGPTLAQVTIAPVPLDVSPGSGTTYVDLWVTDSLSGFSSGSLWLWDPDGNFHDVLYFDATNRIAGDGSDGVYRVPVTLLASDAPGTWRVDVNVHDQLGNTSTYGPDNMPGGAAAAQFAVVSTSAGSYEDWALMYFTPEELLTIGALDADPDNDGAANGLEAALGTDPRDSAKCPVSRGGMSPAGGSHLTISFLRAQNMPSDLMLVVVTSPDLQPAGWTPVVLKAGNAPWSDPSLVEEGGPVDGLVPVTVHGPPGMGPRAFMRLEVSQMPM